MKKGILFGRLMKHITRGPDTIITVLIVSIGIMLMFVYVFGSAIKSSLPDGANYVSYQLPGILLTASASGRCPPFHPVRFGEALRLAQDELDCKNFYAFNPGFDRKQAESARKSTDMLRVQTS